MQFYRLTKSTNAPKKIVTVFNGAVITINYNRKWTVPALTKDLTIENRELPFGPYTFV